MLGNAAVDAAIDGDVTALSPAAAAVLPLLAKVTLDHMGLTAADLAPVLAAGVSAAAIREALDVAWAFNIINRLADAFEFGVGDQASFDASARHLLTRGYK
ncbi:MAG: hypothetical protein R3B06_12085 [Kofleriaceae bacterium]